MAGLAVAGLAVAGRGARYASRTRNQPVEAFGHERRTRAWRWAAQTFDDKWPTAVGLLQLRARIDTELSGQRLAALAGAVGEDIFDAICAQPALALSIDASTVPLTPDVALATGQVAVDAAMADPRGRSAEILDVVAAILKTIA